MAETHVTTLPSTTQLTSLSHELAAILDEESRLGVKLDLLDRIADGLSPDEVRGEDYETVVIMNWMDCILPEVTRWHQIVYVLLGSTSASGEFRVDPAFAAHREAVTTLIASVLEAYVPAMREGAYYREEWEEPGAACLELLKRYRTFTRDVCSFARQILPDANLQKLFERP